MMGWRSGRCDDAGKVQQVDAAIKETESLVVSLDLTVAELVDMLRAYSDRTDTEHS